MPKKVDHQERRERIAAALMRVAASRGLQAVSLRHVAAEAGVTAGMVQHYFPSKEAMLDFAMQSARAGYEARMSEAITALGDEPSIRPLLRTILMTLLPMNAEQNADGRVALAFQAHAATRRDAAERLGDDASGMRDFIADLLRSAQATGGATSAIGADDAAGALLAVADGLGLQVLGSGLPVDTAVATLDAQLDLVLGTATSGQRTEPGRVHGARP